MSSNQKTTLITFGYIRRCCNDLPIQVPIDVIQIITTFYGACCKIFANGWNHRSEWGMGTLFSYSKNYYTLTSMSKLVNDTKDICYCGRKIFLKHGFAVYAAGDNANHRLGLNISERIIKQFQKLTFPEIKDDYIDIISNTHSAEHTFFITKKSKTIYAIGKTNHGRLGGHNSPHSPGMNVETLTILPMLTKLFATENVSKIECGNSHTLILTVSGNVFTCGLNSDNQCGVMTPDAVVNNVTKIITNIEDISAGESHSLCLSDKGELYVFGDNRYQQLGMETPYCSPVMKCKYFEDYSIILERIVAGGWHNIVMDNKGICWGFGWSLYAQLGQRNKTYVKPMKLTISVQKSIQNVYCGPWHSALLTKQNNVYTFGYNGHNECSACNNSDKIYPPYHLERKEIGIEENSHIESVITGYQSTLIIVND